MWYDDDTRHEGAPETTMLSTRWSLARTKHRCDLCGRAIKTGQEYRRTVMLVDGVLQTEKRHAFDCILGDA